MEALGKPVLILNKSWIPIRVRSVRRVLNMIFREKAVIVDASLDHYPTYDWVAWEKVEVSDGDIFIRTTSSLIKIPEVVVLSFYNKVPQYSVKLTKKNIFIRDGYECQYTGDRLDRKEADIDHVVPTSRGGKTEWTNLVVSSKRVNRLKADKTPEEAGLKLKKQPKKPTSRDLIIDPKITYPESWSKFMNIK
jgi:5-methylcytosine-specific restriction endonuclease McrA